MERNTSLQITHSLQASLASSNPWFITGFSDGEACFLVNIYKSSKHKTGWGARATFELGLDQKDLPILNRMKSYLGVGNITSRTNGSCIYSVQSIKDLAVIIDHFDKYPLITKKGADYLLFKMAVNLIKNKEHLTMEGLRKIVAIRASMNWGLPSATEAAFPNIIPVSRPSILDCKIKDPNWLAGFTSGEGCFLVRIINSSSHRLGLQVQLVFKLTQHSRDEQLMRSLVDYLGCGNIYVDGTVVDYKISKFNDITDKLLPFFQKYPIQGVKLLDYFDFISVIELIKNKVHLTEEGLEQIRKIKSGMNRGRQ